MKKHQVLIHLQVQLPVISPIAMEHLYGTTVLSARYLLSLAIPASCLLWLLLFRSQPSELTLRRNSFQSGSPPPPEHQRISQLPPEHQPISPLPPEHQQSSLLPPEHRQSSLRPPEHPSTSAPPAPADRCSGRYIYMHNLPRRFNSDLIRDCRSLCEWTNMCQFVANAGIGLRLTRTGGVLPSTGWYGTNQFTLEVIFHNRMKQYDCLTANSSKAAAVYVPYYAGLDVGRYLWGYSDAVRDSLSTDLSQWLRSSPEWAAEGGRDHFLVAGRIAWDFRREDEDGTDWGNKFLALPEVMNMTVLVIESSPWHTNDFGIPYPTYFHPSKESEVASWQKKMRMMKRPWLFSFAGARRQNNNANIRDRIIGQCDKSRRCGLLQCGSGKNDCYAPGNVMKLFRSSVFCLQPQGDSYTRRSTFDSMLAGCVPVFFHPGSAYVQYKWHLPRDYRKYSVFIPEEEVRTGRLRIEDVLKRYSKREVKAMREQVIKMIPTLIYKDPRSKFEGLKDAVDVAVDGVIERVRKIKEGLFPINEENDSMERGEHEYWGRFFEQ